MVRGEVVLHQGAEGYDPTVEGVLIVPISEESVEAMGNQPFQKVLLGVGINPPSDAQVTYSSLSRWVHDSLLLD